jgi:hypothetical protein
MTDEFVLLLFIHGNSLVLKITHFHLNETPAATGKPSTSVRMGILLGSGKCTAAKA